MAKIRKFALFIVVLFVSLGFFNRLQAQSSYYVEEQRVFYGGLVGGVNFAQVDGDNFAGYHKVGVNVGGIVYAQLAEHVALSLEILYSQKGSKSDNAIFTNVNGQKVVIANYGININYAEIPVMINYFDKRKSHFGIGLSYGQLVSGTENLTTDPVVPIDLTKYPFKKSAIDFLAGVQLHLVKGLFLNVRFQYGIIPLRTNIPPDFSRATQYNNMFVLRLMYLFV
jgi:hypothetical protein